MSSDSQTANKRLPKTQDTHTLTQTHTHSQTHTCFVVITKDAELTVRLKDLRAYFWLQFNALYEISFYTLHFWGKLG